MTKDNPKKAVLYLRSSRDRSDVSIDAQRRRLMEMACARGITVIKEYTDVVESAKSDDRPGFQALLRDIDSVDRQWSVLMMLDHSRLSRERYYGPVFKHRADSKGIDVIYAMSPDLDPASSVLLDSTLDALAVVHSLTSKEKGLYGMAENVHQGYRAGGRAPRGFVLRHVETGAIRDGQPVTKSVLEPSEDAPLIARFLKARAANEPRARVIKELSIPWPTASLIDIEWNALTYAGHTVWNVRNEKATCGGYKGGKKRRPRSDWMIKENTHPALITTDEALRIIERLESGSIGQAVSEGKAGNSAYLLTGLLKAPDGRDWIGDGRKHYRLKPMGEVQGRWLSMDAVDDAVIRKLFEDISSDHFIRALTVAARRANAVGEDPAKDLRQKVSTIGTQISKSVDLALRLEDPSPMLRKITELETKRKLLLDEIGRTERDYQAQVLMAQVSEDMVRKSLSRVAADFETLPREKWKQLVRNLAQHIELDPESLECQIHYRIAVEDRLSMASPRGVEPLSPP